MNPLAKGPVRPHLVRPGGGLRGEVAVLREQALQGVLATLGRSVIWSNGDGDAKTWKEVMALVGLGMFGPHVTPETVPEGVGTMFIGPAGTYDFKNGKFVAAFVGTNGANVGIEPDVTLRNVSMLVGTNVRANLAPPGHGAKMEWTGRNPGDVIVLFCMFGGGVQNDGPDPVIRVTSDNPFIIGQMLGGGFGDAGQGPVVSLGPGAVLFAITVNSTTGLVLGNNTVVSDDNTSAVLIGHTGNFTGFPSLPGFLGTMVNVPLNSDGGSGPTAARPSAGFFGPIPPGVHYYDTDITKPIIWDGAAWYDYAGNPV